MDEVRAMKSRTDGFLSKENIDHDGEVFDYIKELHEYLWKFVRKEIPGASGKLEDFIEAALIKPNPRDLLLKQCKEALAVAEKALHDPQYYPGSLSETKIATTLSQLEQAGY